MEKNQFLFLMLFFIFGNFYRTSAQTVKNDLKDSTKSAYTLNTIGEGIKTQKAWKNTAAVFTISGKELERMNVANLLNALQGRIPGLTVVTGSGEPGYDNPTLYVRGQTSWNITGNRVLIYLDGFQVDMSAIAPLAADEIASVTLLKDAASTALYGLQGGAGVLVVNTKSGKVSPRSHITFQAKYGIQSPIKLPKVLDAYDYTRFYNLALENDNLPIKYTNPSLYKRENDPFHPNVNWYNKVLKNTSNIQDYNLSFRGGSEKANYYVLMDYMNHKGLYKNASILGKDFGTNAKYTKLNLKANVELQLSKNLSIKAFLLGITEDRTTPGGFSASQEFGNILKIPASSFPVKNPDDSWGNNSVFSFNPVERLRRGGFYRLHTRTVQTSFLFNEKLNSILPGLSLNGGISFSNQYLGYYQKLFTIPTYQIIKGANDEPVRDGNGNLTYRKIGEKSQEINDAGNSHWNRTSSRVGLRYDRSFGKHTLNTMLLGQRELYNHQGQTYQVHTHGLSADIVYNYDKRYIVDLTGAYSGSDGFSKGNRYGFFPAISVGWIASNERFLRESKVVNFLKIRSSFGTSGNINEDFRFLYDQIAYGDGSWIVGSNNSVKGGMMEGRFANVDASWEEKTTLNIGLDMKLWSKLRLTLDVFSEKRTGIYEDPSAFYPDFAGFSLPYVNGGEVSNHGFEAVLSYHGESTEFKYYISGLVSFARNKVTKRSETKQPFDYLYSKGYRLGQRRGLVFDGFYQESDFQANGELKNGVVKTSFTNAKPGDMKFVDQDGNGIINDYDKIPMFYANLPEITLGLNLGFSFHGFDFNAFIQGVMHRTVSLLDVAYDYTHPFVDHNNITPFSTNSWTPQTTKTATTPRLSTLSNENNDQPSDFWFRNGNFLKLRNVEIGYTLPKVGFLKRIESVRLSVGGTNLLTLDNIKGLEAENLSMGYPLMKSIDFGMKIKF